MTSTSRTLLPAADSHTQTQPAAWLGELHGLRKGLSAVPRRGLGVRPQGGGAILQGVCIAVSLECYRLSDGLSDGKFPYPLEAGGRPRCGGGLHLAPGPAGRRRETAGGSEVSEGSRKPFFVASDFSTPVSEHLLCLAPL